MNKLSLSFLLFVFVMVVSAQSAWAQIREAKVTGGLVKGSVSDGVSSFKGIPFAAPPTGDLRWKAPQPVSAWNGTKKTNSFGPACMQPVGNISKFGSTTSEISEDCLYLNVWTAAKVENEKRPVMVWIYGGGFGSPVSGAGTAEAALSNVMISYWVNFAKSGEPNGQGLPPWPAFTEQQQAAMYFGDTSVGARVLPNVEKLKVFDLHYARLRREAKESAPDSK